MICKSSLYTLDTSHLPDAFTASYFGRSFGRHLGGKVNRPRWPGGGEGEAGTENAAPISGAIAEVGS